MPNKQPEYESLPRNKVKVLFDETTGNTFLFSDFGGFAIHEACIIEKGKACGYAKMLLDNDKIISGTIRRCSVVSTDEMIEWITLNP